MHDNESVVDATAVAVPAAEVASVAATVPASVVTPAARVVEKPDLRSFGATAGKGGSLRVNKFTKEMIAAGALIILGVGSYMAYPVLTSPSAPPINLVSRAAAASTPAVAASAPSAAASAPGTGDVILTTDAEVVVEPATLVEAKDQLSKMREKVARLTQELEQSKQQVTDLEQMSEAKSAPKHTPKTKAKSAPQPPVEDEYVTLAVLDISVQGVVVSDSVSQYTITPGAQLPGGAIYIGFDATSRVMKTDQGDFVIP